MNIEALYQARAWQMVFDALLAHNPKFCEVGGRTIDLALREIQRLQEIETVCRQFHATVRSVGWRTFADQHVPNGAYPTPEEHEQISKANQELDKVFGHWSPPDTPENRARKAIWDMQSPLSKDSQ